jgi:two-component system sensor histidine kinase LytS
MKRLPDYLDNFVGMVLVLCIFTMLVVFVSGIVLGQTVISIVAGAGIVAVVFVGATASSAPDSLRSQATERTLRTASHTLDQMRDGLTVGGCRAVCQLLLPETKAIAVAMTDTQRVLAYVGELESEYPPGSKIHTQATRDVLASGALQTFSSITQIDEDGWDDEDADGRRRRARCMPAGIVAPLVVRDRTIGTIKFYFKSPKDIDRTQLALARGFAELLSTQLSSWELDRQASLTAQAEVKALQAQINPHFLFNTINTIASFTRTDPARARDLLREFAVFYRQTLENSESLIPLSRELDQTRRYLTFEYARFGEDRIVEQELIEPEMEELLVPAFIIQPIVENAVRHAMREEGPLHIDIHVTVQGEDVLIAVADDGNGMEQKKADALLADSGGFSSSEKGTGIALRNVSERLARFYGPGSGVEIISRPDEGTVVTLRLAGAAKADEDAL